MFLTRERHLSDLKSQVKIVYSLQLFALSAFIELALQNCRDQVVIWFYMKLDRAVYEYSMMLL